MAIASTYNKDANAIRVLQRSGSIIDAPVLTTSLAPTLPDPQTLIKPTGIQPALIDGQIKTPVSGQGQGIFSQIIDLGKVFLEKNPNIVGTAQPISAYNVAAKGQTVQYQNTGEATQQQPMRDDVKIVLLVGGGLLLAKLFKLF